MSAIKRLDSARKVSGSRVPSTPVSSSSLSPRPTPQHSSSASASASATFKLHDTIYVTGTEKYGSVRYCGPVHFSTGEWVGIELENPIGKNDGSVQGHRYFDCRPLYGLFVRSSICSKSKPTILFPASAVKEVSSSSSVSSIPQLCATSAPTSASVPNAVSEPVPALSISVEQLTSDTAVDQPTSSSSINSSMTPMTSPRYSTANNNDNVADTDNGALMSTPSPQQQQMVFRSSSIGRGRISMGGDDVDDFGLPLRQVPSRRASDTRTTPSSTIKPRIMDSRLAGLVQARLNARPNTPVLNRSSQRAGESMLDRLDSALVLPGKQKPKPARPSTPTMRQQPGSYSNASSLLNNSGNLNGSVHGSSGSRPETPSTELDSTPDDNGHGYAASRSREDFMSIGITNSRSLDLQDDDSVHGSSSTSRNIPSKSRINYYHSGNNGALTPTTKSGGVISDTSADLTGPADINSLIDKLFMSDNFLHHIKSLIAQQEQNSNQPNVQENTASVFGTLSRTVFSLDEKMSSLQDNLASVVNHLESAIRSIAKIDASAADITDCLAKLSGLGDAATVPDLQARLKSRDEEVQRLQLSMQSVLGLVKRAKEATDLQNGKYLAEIADLKQQVADLK